MDLAAGNLVFEVLGNPCRTLLHVFRMLFRNKSGTPFILALFTAEKMYAVIGMDKLIEIAKVVSFLALDAWKSHRQSSFIANDNAID